MVELVFLMLIMKLPIVYLVAVVWYAVRAEPRPFEPAVVPAEKRPGPHRPSVRRPSGRPRVGPHGRPSRRPLGGRRTVRARGEGRR